MLLLPSLIRQWNDYITRVEDRHWASNRNTLKFDWTVQEYFENMTWLHLFSYIFSTSGQMSQYFCCISGKNCLLNLLLMWLKRLTITQGKCWNGLILRRVLSPVLLKWPIWLLCMKPDPSLRDVQWPSSTFHNTSLANQKTVCTYPTMHLDWRPITGTVTFYSLIAFDERVNFWLQRVRLLPKCVCVCCIICT